MQPSLPSQPIAGSSRSIVPTDRKRPVPSLPRHRPQPEPINVDAEYTRKYEILSDDMIMPIDAETFRQNFRERSKGKERQQSAANEREKEKAKGPLPQSVTTEEIISKSKKALRRNESDTPQSTASAFESQRPTIAGMRADTNTTGNHTGLDFSDQQLVEAFAKIGYTAVAAMSMLPTPTNANIANFPSQIGPTIAEMKRNRPMAPQEQSVSTPTPNKRRKIDSSESTARTSQAAGTSSTVQTPTAPSSRHIQQHQPIAGPSQSYSTPNAIAGPSHRPATTQHKRKPMETYDHDDELEVVEFLEPNSNSARKRPKLAVTPASSSTHPSSASSRVQTPLHKPMPLETLVQAKRHYEVIELSSDDEKVDIVSPKKKAKVAVPPPNAPQDHTPIEISSDSESNFDFDFDRNLDPVDTYIPSPVLKPKVEPDLLDDDGDDDNGDDDYDEWIPPGFDLNDPDRWKPLNTDSNTFLDNALSNTLGHLNIEDSKSNVVPSPERYIPPDTSKFDPRPRRRKRIAEPIYIWDMLAQTVNVRVPPRPRPAAFQLGRPYMPLWKEDFDLYRMKRAFYDPNGFYELKKAPGSINKVVQKGCWTVIASGCLGGLPDVPNEEPSPHNREGTLMTLREELDIPKGHEVKKSQPPRTKYYAVNDVQFDPLRKAFVSTGADCRLRLWSLQDDEEDEEEDPNAVDQDSPPPRARWTNRMLKPYKNVPYDLAFKPHSSILAVAERQVRLYSLSQPVPEPLGLFALYPAEAPHIVGAMAWGAESTSNHLFASSEPLEVMTFEGMHKAYDIREKKTIYSFDAKESGDNLCVGTTGCNLALSTRGEENKPILRLYDVARRDGKATSIVDLEPFPVRYPNFEGEVNGSMFSPDGLFLALARSDNETHVYDMRYIHRGPLYRYEHTGESQASDKRCLYGIVKAQWIQSARSRRMALVTGGEDGCVRVWDPNLSAADSRNGTAIAQVNSDIGHFSLGDPFAGEHRLVVGDCSGEISVFDNVI